jgi:hypothetical protein
LNDTEQRLTGTYAVLVGIEKYGRSDRAGRLPGAVADVTAMAEWLIKRRVPAANIHILLSPLPNTRCSVSNAAVSISESATANEIAATVSDVISNNGSVLFLYWAGRGYAVDGEERGLYCADADIPDSGALDLTQLLKYIRKGGRAGEALNGTNFPQQIIVVDACATQWDPIQHHGKPGTVKAFDVIGGRDRAQFALLAEYGRRLAWDKSTERGLFTTELLKVLDAQPDNAWPPDMDCVAGELAARLDSINERVGDKQEIVVTQHGWRSGAVKGLVSPRVREGRGRRVLACVCGGCGIAVFLALLVMGVSMLGVRTCIEDLSGEWWVTSRPSANPLGQSVVSKARIHQSGDELTISHSIASDEEFVGRCSWLNRIHYEAKSAQYYADGVVGRDRGGAYIEVQMRQRAEDSSRETWRRQGWSTFGE